MRGYYFVEKTWENNQTLKNIALKKLRSGVKSSEVYTAVKSASDELKIPFWQDIDIGHGVGTSEREAPYLAPFDDTPLMAGMVIALGIYTYGDDDELICNKDMYLVTDEEPRLLNWYKSWDDLYVVYGTSARHG
ncbi:MAG: M24 family metallopeptidase [Emcibacteraceae bacterium]|nr:M24 family metallopeptidase [Emcibacteraceae bacterium]